MGFANQVKNNLATTVSMPKKEDVVKVWNTDRKPSNISPAMKDWYMKLSKGDTLPSGKAFKKMQSDCGRKPHKIDSVCVSDCFVSSTLTKHQDMLEQVLSMEPPKALINPHKTFLYFKQGN